MTPTETGQNVLNRLTPRERTILPLVCEGFSNGEIAAQLGIGRQVVKNYLRVIYDKAGVDNRVGMAVFAFYHGLVNCPCTARHG